MRLFLFRISCLLLILAALGCLAQNPMPSPRPLPYPVTRTVDHVDDYSGTKVADPYRWLEDDQAPDTQAWVAAQNRVTFDFLSRIPARTPLKKRLTSLWDYERFGVPFLQGGRYFLTKNDGLQNQSVLYTLRSLDAQPALLLDPNKLSPDGTVALMGYSVSEDGRLLAYGTSAAGSDWMQWRVRQIDTGTDLPDQIDWVKSSGAAWTKDGKGFFYSRYDAPKPGDTYKGLNYFHKLYYHRLGTPQAQDPLIYHRPDQKEWGFGGGVTDDGRYLVISVWQGTDTRNRFFYQDLSRPGTNVVELLNDFDADYSFIDNLGPVFYFRTDYQAPRGRIIAIDVAQPAKANWREIVPQTADRLLGANLVGGQLIANYLQDAHSEVKLFEENGRFLRTLALPGLGTVGGFGGKRADTETFYSFTSFTTPATIYRYDLRAGASAIFRQPKLQFNPADYETRQVFYPSKDGTRIPMFLTHKKGLKFAGRAPTLLYGYGGFDISLTPSFSPGLLAWLELGGLYAQPSLRGGGEYGQEWHHAGMKHLKQNVFDDFIAAAQWLVANGCTCREKLALMGGSNGGLLVGACMTQRPELFGAALPAVGVMDMLRFNKFTRGWAWTSEYGSPEDPADFKALYAYSPLHHLKPGTAYPATLITTSDHDDRVVPAHSFKFAAALQAAQRGPAPVLIRIETKAGHGAGKPTGKLIDETADKWAFLVQALGIAGLD